MTYVAAFQWPDGDTKQGSFQMDRNLYRQMKHDQGEHCPSWEHIVLQMMAQTIEQLLTKRDVGKKIIVLPK